METRKNAFVTLGAQLRKITSGSEPNGFPEAERLFYLMEHAQNYNTWFTPCNIRFCFDSWAKALSEENMNKWLNSYSFSAMPEKNIGIVMAGNIPMVGFHDLLCVLMSGHRATVKCSSSDNQLIPATIELLGHIEPGFREKVVFTEGLMKEADAFIATGSNNSGRYFDYYFSKYPHIIRRHRNSVAVLQGDESPEALKGLAEDIFRYFGLGCRNVSKIYVPENYDFSPLINALSEWEHIDNHHKYHNNYDYNKAITLINRDEYLDGGFFLLKRSPELSSPISVIAYEYYKNMDEATNTLTALAERLQCIVASSNMPSAIPFGKAQHPMLWDYADSIDTMDFLLNIGE